MKNFIKQNLISILILTSMLVITFYYFGSLPPQIPLHFDINGNPNSYGNKLFASLILPGTFLGLIILIPLLVKISPSKFKMESSQNSISRIIFAIGLMFFFIQFSIIKGSISGEKIVYIRYLSMGIGLFMVAAGNYFSKVERNFFIGIRTPWTIVSEATWLSTHRLAAKLMFIFGIASIGISYIFPNLTVVSALLITSTIIPAVYSYFHYNNKQKVDEGV